MNADFPRTLGVPGNDTPRFPESAPALTLVPRDLSIDATPACEDLKNALMIIAPLEDSMIREALDRLIRSALEKIETDDALRCPHMAVVA
jgi:hypothetical protein